jgi:1,2-diacylglycerol 3-alpha-glucosyltransferase
MKILVCASEYYPYGSGIANVTFNVVEQFKKQGITCIVCSPTGPDIKLGNRYLIQKTGILGLLYYWYQVSRFIKNNEFDAVWLNNPFFIISNSFSHVLVTMHSTYHGESIHQVGDSFHLRLYKKFVAIIERNCLLKMKSSIIFSGVGQPVCNELAEIGIKKDRMILIPNGVDCNKFHPSENKKIIRKKFGIPEEDVVLLSVGRLTPAKQPYLMIKVFSILEKQMDKITFCIAGKGELLANTQRLAKKEGGNKIKFLGQLDNQKDLPDLYACSDYYLLTSIYEGGMPPLTLAEAMATGLPCMVSDIPNLKIVLNADCGIIICFDEIEKTANTILNYLKSEHSDHAKNAREYAQQFLDWEIISKQYLKIFLTIRDLNRSTV